MYNKLYYNGFVKLTKDNHSIYVYKINDECV